MNAEIGGEPIGNSLSQAYALTYSLHPLKNVHGWTDGGVIATNDAVVDWSSRSLRNHGLEGRDIWKEPGYNHRMSTVEATIVSEVLNDFDTMAQNRANNATILDEACDGVRGLSKPHVQDGTTHAYHLYQIIVDGERDEFKSYMEDVGVECKIHYGIPFHLQPAVRSMGYARGDFPIAEKFCEQHVSVPIHEYLTEPELNHMAETILAFGKAGA